MTVSLERGRVSTCPLATRTRVCDVRVHAGGFREKRESSGSSNEKQRKTPTVSLGQFCESG